MEGASSGLAGQPDDILPKEAQLVLAWNPRQWRTEGEDVSMPTRASPDKTQSALKNKSTTIGYSRQAAFYDRHLAPHLILERVVIFDALVSTMAKTVDQAIQDAVAKRPLPKKTGSLLSEEMADIRDKEHSRTKYHETGVAESYSHASLYYFRPIASTLALHPSSAYWGSILTWTFDGKLGRWAIADGVLRISPSVFEDDKWKQQMLQNEDNEKEGILKQLAKDATALAVWEMKSLTVGTAQVMQEILEMGLIHAKFPWKKCPPTVCDHRSLDRMKESKESYDAGFDPRSPPWTLPIVPPISSADSRPISPCTSLRSASAQGGMTTRPSYKEPSLSPMEDGERERKKRRHSNSDTSKLERPPKKSKKSKKSKADLMDESYEPPPGARKEFNAQSFLQQVT